MQNHFDYGVILGIVLSSFDFMWPLTIYGWYNYLPIQWLLIVLERRFEILARYLSDFGALNLSRDLICKFQLWAYYWNVHINIHISFFWPIINFPELFGTCFAFKTTGKCKILKWAKNWMEWMKQIKNHLNPAYTWFTFLWVKKRYL